MTSAATNLTLVDTDPAELEVDALVIGVHAAEEGAEGDDGPAGGLLLGSGAESVAAAFDGRLTGTLALLGSTGAAGEVVKLATLGALTAPLVVAVGLGPEPAGAGPAAETLRRATAAAVRALAGCRRVALALPVVPDDADAPASATALRAVAEGALLGAYRFAGYKTKPQPNRKDAVGSVAVHVPDAADAAARAELDRAAIVTAAVAQARDWVNAAPNHLRPPDFAEAVAAVAGAAGLAVEVLDEAALRAGGYGGILAVGLGSSAAPRLVRLTYIPDVPDAPRIALVGKGITFDSGGVSVKPAQGMWEMKSDMAGAAAVAATMLAVARLRPPVAVTAYLPMAENMLSGSSYRPGDVVTMRNGKRVEVLNTDAEGRMLLGDAICDAAADGYDYLLETSTLTGGQLVALGKRVAGVMGEERLCERVRAAGDAVGEPGWPMPIPEDVRKGMDSDIADVLQVAAGMDRAGHMIQGAAFLREFVLPDAPWAHIDVAGPAYHSGEPTGYLAKGGTGVPMRTLLQVIDDIAAEGA
ncbi:leucyl aminopeptidase [Rhizomonospora bruguierae]|uniref:leucyl aminopeptidase n=1 Tax=Rhizomonospora bruguierae TaxID=1581705 RepID=UPI001BCEF9BF|nr:leucyl aminopeptidase [Micromonospora sp. NBRC 107566]